MCGGRSDESRVVASETVDKCTGAIGTALTSCHTTTSYCSSENENGLLEICSAIVGQGSLQKSARCVSNKSSDFIFDVDPRICSNFSPTQNKQLIDTDAHKDTDESYGNLNEQVNQCDNDVECTSSKGSIDDDVHDNARNGTAQSCYNTSSTNTTEDSSLGIDTAMIQEIGAKAAAAAAAAVFERRAEVAIEEPSPTYSVQTLDVDTPEKSITSPVITFPLPLFGAGNSHCNTSGKKRRRSNESTASSSHSSDEGGAGSIKSKRALFLPQKKKKKKKSPQSIESKNDCAYTSRNSSLLLQSTPRAATSNISARVSMPVDSRPSKPCKISKVRIEVRTVAPTVRGIREAARILLSSTKTNHLAYPISQIAASGTANSDDSTSSLVPFVMNEGILSFPTETAYTLTTCIRVQPLLRSLSTSSALSTSASSLDADERSLAAAHNSCLSRLLHIKGKPSTKSEGPTKVPATKTTDIKDNSVSSPSIGTDPDPALLYIHTPAQSRDFVHFTKPKTFVLKPCSDSNLKFKNTTKIDGKPGRQSPKSAQQVPAVTFSESREVLDRLANAFWPGPVIIFAKCKMRRTLRDSLLPPIQENFTLSPFKMTSLERATTGKSEEDEVIYAPILPTSVLYPRIMSATIAVDGGTFAKSPYYVGMRCPSHPLARRVLDEVYFRNTTFQQQPSGRHVLSHVVVGFNARSSTWSDCPINAKEVSSQLNGATIETSSQFEKVPTSFIDVLNGEDECEMFVAPTCQFGVGACSSLVIDDDNKAIHIVHAKDESAKATLKPKDIIRALRTSPRSSVDTGAQCESVAAGAEKVASRVITAVLNRWNVVEETYLGTSSR